MMKKERSVFFLAVLSLVWFIAFKFNPGAWLKFRPAAYQDEMLRAAENMNRAIQDLGNCRSEKGLVFDGIADPNSTGLIGLETSLLTTSLGDLQAKRTTTNPAFAALLVHLLKKAGLESGDCLAVGASGSFPALAIAALAAAEAMGVRPILICSLGASQWGANDPEFNWLHIQDCLLNSGFMKEKPAALSLGGEEDMGLDFDPGLRNDLLRRIGETGIVLIEESGLERNVRERILLYESNAAGSEIKAFINIGGNWANLGTDSEILRLKPGLASVRQYPEAGRRGMVFEMAGRGIPVIHLLNIRGICERYGLSWDPLPLPAPGQGGFDFASQKNPLRFAFFLTVYLILAAAILIAEKPGRDERQPFKNLPRRLDKSS